MTAIKNILALTDFSKNAAAAEEYALQLAIKAHANLVLYNVYPLPSRDAISGNIVWPHDPSISAELQSISNLQARVYELKGELSKMSDDSYKPEIRHLGDAGSLTHKLKDIIEENNIWLAVMGTKGESFAGNVLFGSNVFKILDTINCPVLIIPIEARCRDLKKIVYATDLRSTDLFIIEWLQELSGILQVELDIMHVSAEIISTNDAVSKNITEQILFKKTPNHIHIKYLQGKNITDSLHEITEQHNVDILALIHRKYGFFDSLVHASISHKMIKHTKIPILNFPDSGMERDKVTS